MTSGIRPQREHPPDPPAVVRTAHEEIAERPSATPWSPTAIFLFAAIPFIAFFLVQIACFDYGRDQGIYAVVARSMLEGGMPYRDAWDFKPPGIFVVFAAARALFGSSQWSIRLLEIGGLVAMVWAMTRLAHRFWNDARIGLLGGALAVMVHAQLDFWHTSQPESFGGMLTIFGLLLGTRGWKATSTRLPETRPVLVELVGPEPTPPHIDPPFESKTLDLLLSGVLFGLAALLKPPLGGGGAVLAGFLGWQAWGSREARDPTTRATVPAPRTARALRPAIWIALGGALPIAACLIWFAARGALGDLYETLFVFTPNYTALGWEGASVLGMLYYALTEWLVAYSGPMTLGVLLLLACGLNKADAALAALLLAVVGIHLVGVAMQGKFFPYHYGATWPATGLLAALGIFRGFETARRRGTWAVAILGAALLAAAFARTATKDVPRSFSARSIERMRLALEGGTAWQWTELASVADVNAGANLAVADFLRSWTPADRSVLVWGFEPVIYDLSDRESASRYIYNVAQRTSWGRETARKQLMSDLDRRPPSAIVVEHRDVFPSVTGDPLDSADVLAGFPELAQRIDERYRLARTIEDFDIYLEAVP